MAGHFKVMRADLRAIDLPKRFVNEPVRLCPLCLHEDVQKYGVPYIHLSHQMPSVRACSKHGVEDVRDEACIDRVSRRNNKHQPSVKPTKQERASKLMKELLHAARSIRNCTIEDLWRAK